jgi:hypothetical protein
MPERGTAGRNLKDFVFQIKSRTEVEATFPEIIEEPQ